MISVEQARAHILAALRASPAEIVALAEAWGRVAASDVSSRVTQPPHDVSAMDGYAVRAADGTKDAGLRVVGSAPAGHPWAGTLAPGEALRLFTGSVVPAGADSILIQENARADGDHIFLTEPVVAGRHIRRAGQDFSTGDVLVSTGTKLGARDVGLLAAGNHPWVAVHRRPRVAILATGDEIALPGEAIPPGGIVSSNAHALAALVRARGGDPLVLPIAPDDRAAIAAAGAAARGCDLLVTTGGASVGEHDLVAAGLGEKLVLDFWKIAMRPGKPLMSGRLGEVPMIGLPGNPVSSMVCAVLFLVPAIERLCGLAGDPPRVSQAVLGAALRANDVRADHLRCALDPGTDGVPVATAFESQDSALLRLLARADGLILRPPHAPRCRRAPACRLFVSTCLDFDTNPQSTDVSPPPPLFPALRFLSPPLAGGAGGGGEGRVIVSRGWYEVDAR